MVDYSSLENCRTERYRGFESLSLRKKESNDNVRFLFLCLKINVLYFISLIYCFLA